MNLHAAGKALAAVLFVLNSTIAAAQGYSAVDFSLTPATHFWLAISSVGIGAAIVVLPSLGSRRGPPSLPPRG